MQHKRPRIIMAVTNDLVTDQRVHRSCSALEGGGYRITLVGRLLPNSPAVRRNYKTVRMRLLFRKKAFFYAEYNIRLFLRLLFSPADAFYANDTDTLLACYMAARVRRKPLFFDAHEMFPEVPELVGRPRVKRFWEGIEERILPRMAKRDDMAASTVCQSIADIYRERYGLKMAVVRNVPVKRAGIANPLEQGSDVSQLLSTVKQGRRVLLYQGAVNVGRGIEAVMEAMPFLPECHFLIAGVGDKYDELRARADEMQCDNITFLGRLEPDVLHSLTVHADLGISLLENMGLNYYYSLPNRIADFVQVGVPVLATDFPEIHRVVTEYGIGMLVPPFEGGHTPSPLVPRGTPPNLGGELVTKSSNRERGLQIPLNGNELATIIREALSYWDSVSEEQKKSIFGRAAADLSWENDKKVLIAAVNTIFQTKRR